MFIEANPRRRGWRSSHLDDLPGLHGQRGEVAAAVDRDALAQDGVQPLHLIPRQHAEPPALLGGITVGGRHDDSRSRVSARKEREEGERAARARGPPLSLSLFSDSGAVFLAEFGAAEPLLARLKLWILEEELQQEQQESS